MQKTFILLIIFMSFLLLFSNLISTHKLEKSIGRFLGDEAFFLLSLTLLISPLSKIDSRFAKLIYLKRPLGILVFIFGLLHALYILKVYFNLDILFVFENIWIIAGLIGLIILFPLAITSNNFSIKTLGPKNWKKLQSLAYLAFILLYIHSLGMMKFSIKDFSNLFSVFMGSLVIVLRFYVYLKDKREEKSQEKIY
jgi:DMSO/TMAO reductase YedYZ heme-binding membrane subunit